VNKWHNHHTARRPLVASTRDIKLGSIKVLADLQKGRALDELDQDKACEAEHGEAAMHALH
jgi:hypothetical protein